MNAGGKKTKKKNTNILKREYEFQTQTIDMCLQISNKEKKKNTINKNYQENQENVCTN